MDALEVLDPMREGDPGKRLDQVERPAHGGVSDGVHRDRDAVIRRRAHRVGRFRLRGDRHPPVAASLVRVEHPRGPAPEAAVEKQLHPAHAEPAGAGAAPLAAAHQIGQRRDRRMEQHPKPEIAGILEPAKGGPGAPVLHVVQSGHPQPMRLRLRVPQRFVEHLRRWCRPNPSDQVHGTLQQQPGRLTSGVPDDPAARRVRRFPGHPGDRQGRAVHPGGVDVERIEVDGSGMHPVERVPVGGLAPRHWHPTRARQPNPATELLRRRERPPRPAFGHPRGAPDASRAPTWRSGCVRPRIPG